MPVAQKKIRVQLDFDEQGFAELESLKADMRAGSRADTVRYGLGLLRWAVDQLKGGARILVEKDGNLSGVVFPFLPTQQIKSASSTVTLHDEERAPSIRASRDDLGQRAREAREQAENWAERGRRELYNAQKEQIRSAVEAGKEAYRQQRREKEGGE